MAERIIDIHCGWGATALAPQWNDLGAIRMAMQARGIEAACLAPMIARRYDLLAGDDALGSALVGSEAGEAGGVDLRGWLVIHPARLVDSNTLMRRHLYGDRFVGAALYPDPLTGLPVTLRDSVEVINSYRRFARPLLIEAHTATAMAEVVRIAETLGSMKIIASGMGGDEWYEAITMAAQPLNLYLDISGALVPEKIVHALATLHGTRKLLFASGAPQTDPAAVLGMLDDVPLSHDDRERILYINAARLLHVGEVATVPATLAPITRTTGAAADSAPEITDLLDILGQAEPPPDPNAA